MKLEDLPKYYSPKSPGLTDASASTSKDALSITDVMAAQGMTQNRAEMGFSAFLGKMGISMNDRNAQNQCRPGSCTYIFNVFTGWFHT